MTINEVKEQLAAIEAAAGDPEVAHGLEEALHQEVLSFISNHTAEQLGENAVEIIELADLALTTEEIKFPRWMA